MRRIGGEGVVANADMMRIVVALADPPPRTGIGDRPLPGREAEPRSCPGSHQGGPGQREPSDRRLPGLTCAWCSRRRGQRADRASPAAEPAGRPLVGTGGALGVRVPHQPHSTGRGARRAHVSGGRGRTPPHPRAFGAGRRAAGSCARRALSLGLGHVSASPTCSACSRRRPPGMRRKSLVRGGYARAAVLSRSTRPG